MNRRLYEWRLLAGEGSFSCSVLGVAAACLTVLWFLWNLTPLAWFPYESRGWGKSLYGSSSCWETTPGVRRRELAGQKQGRRAMWCRVQCQAGLVKAPGDNQAGPLWGALSQNGHPRDGSGEPLLISAPERINSLAFSIAFVWVITAESGMPKSRWEKF